MYNLYCRIVQSAYKTVAQFLPWRQPLLLEGEESLKQLPSLLTQHSIQHVLIVSDEGISKLGLMDGLLDGLTLQNIQYAVYDKTVPNPTIDNIEEALKVYQSSGCQGIIAFGGGSPMDCAKGVAARVARPEKTLPQLKGQLKVRKSIPPLVAIPTTAGTGSETTIVSVVSNSETHEKYAINDPVLTPHFAVMDPLLTVGLPKHITSTTGMDALTHAVEAYIGRSNTPQTKQWSLEATKLIFENLFEAYEDGNNIKARAKMQRASFLAGRAFTRAYVGYIHAIAHTLGGFYNVPHGLANAVIMPYVLEYYGEAVHKPLAELADLTGITDSTDSDEVKCKKFIEAIREMNEKMDIPETISSIKISDIPLMVERAYKEANPLYPVPRILNKKELETLYILIKT
ncbi:iron-containing alcohol dehydrogenase [Sporosarcina gallistercoris]|uniref:Iron-containing alcohol dehydrogenase n=1 Tax=Sporosarcina gallistercoris TaxID=2762245 RepID=A0ABR8PJT8_9BACL|nr:iron-containing alcohol dehydrogenase [Sporosarcina gallistercoris]MBD7908433.1 iron-containing alcohol dehydrogenase [Sporosarcina gallistercoris]